MNKSVFTVREITYCAIFAALLAVCSWISVPLAVPITLQTFAVFAVVEFLGLKCGTAAISVWLLIGAAGAPVFSNFKGGIGALTGATGGYILGFLLCPFTAVMIRKLFGEKGASMPVRAASLLAALIVCYAFGTAWFMVIYTRTKGSITLGDALGKCVLPFIAFDCIKLALAEILYERAGKFVRLGEA